MGVLAPLPLEPLSHGKLPPLFTPSASFRGTTAATPPLDEFVVYGGPSDWAPFTDGSAPVSTRKDQMEDAEVLGKGANQRNNYINASSESEPDPNGRFCKAFPQVHLAALHDKTQVTSHAGVDCPCFSYVSPFDDNFSDLHKDPSVFLYRRAIRVMQFVCCDVCFHPLVCGVAGNTDLAYALSSNRD